MDRGEPRGGAAGVEFEHAEPEPERIPVRASPYVWRDPATIPPREWLYGRHIARKHVSATIAAGAAGKSSLVIVEALAMVTGRPLLGVPVPRRLRVWLINLEDPLEEMERRVAAACLHYGIERVEVEGRLFLDSGRTQEIVIATEDRSGVRIAEPVVADVIAALLNNDIDVAVIDPFVSSHRVAENSNVAVDIVAKTWNRIAETGEAGIELVHHTRKGQAGQGEFTVEDGRGAGALLAASRSARVLNVMTKTQAEDAGLPSHRGYFRTDNGKANLAPPPEASNWFALASVCLGNGPPGLADASDYVGVVTTWAWPDAFQGIALSDLIRAQAAVADGGPWRASVQANDWVGVPIARVLNLDIERKADRTKLSRMLKVWTENGMFVVTQAPDRNRKVRAFVEVGKPANSGGD